MKEDDNNVEDDLKLGSDNEKDDSENEDDEKKSDSLVSNSKQDSEPERNEENCNAVIEEFTKVKNCSILLYGVKPSPEKIKFGYCRTCDSNLMTPICGECLIECHKKLDHDIREMNEPDNIICGCGEKMHKFKVLEKKNKLRITGECPYSDWCEKSGLSTLYIVEDKCVCEFCYRMCGYEGKGSTLEKEKEMLQVCECEKLNGVITHTDLKHIYKTLEEIIAQKEDLIIDISPEHFINLLFLGKSSYEAIFFNVEETIQNFTKLSPAHKLEIKDNFTSTNFYLSLNVFSHIIEKTKYIPIKYYSQEFAKKVSFEIVSNVLKNIVYRDTKTFWEFLKITLFLFRKVSLHSSTSIMSKFKFKDLDNMTPLQRKCLFMTNHSFFPQATQQVDFFIETSSELLNQEISLIESYDVVIELASIFKTYSQFYLFTNTNMSRFCFVIEKMMNYLKNKKSYVKKIKLYYLLMKILGIFIFCYNDNSFFNYLVDNRKDNSQNVKFVFYKSELGRLISRNVIRMMYYTLIIKKKKKLQKQEETYCKRILDYGTKILSLMLTERDNYFMNSLNANHFPSFLFQVLSIQSNNQKYELLRLEVKQLEDIYCSYYSFESDKIEVIKAISDSLDKQISKVKNFDIRPYVLKSNYYYVLVKSLYIIDFNEEESNVEEAELIKNFIPNLFLFLHYFVENNYHNSILVCSHFILQALLKLPNTYIIDIFKLYTKCSELIQKNRGIISECAFVIRGLFNYLMVYKKTAKSKWIKESQDFFLDDVNILDQVTFFFLDIVIKLFLQTKLLYPASSGQKIKNILIDFLTVFDYGELMNFNACLTLILLNKIFDSSSQTDREILMKLIPIQKIVVTLEDTNLEIDFRTEILIFLKQFKCSIFFKQIETIKKKVAPLISPKDTKYNDFNDDKTTENKKNKIRQKKTRKQTYIKSLEEEVDIDIVTLFSLNNEEILKHNDYLNAIGQDGDNFSYIKNNPLISNYKYPTKYLSFYYFFLKNEDIDHNFKIAEAAIELFEKELKRFKDIFEKNTNYPNKMFRYYIKGIVIPICSIIRLVFCYTGDCNGYNILMLYQIMMKMMYIKNFILDVSNSFLSEKISVQFDNFDINGFLNKDMIEEDLDDYFSLKDRDKFSPYDFTHLWEIFDKHFLAFIKYPESINLEENFPSKDINYFCYGKISEETDLLEGAMNLNLRKKGGNSIMRKGFNKSQRNNFVLSTTTAEPDKDLKFTVKNSISKSSVAGEDDEDKDKEKENKDVINFSGISEDEQKKYLKKKIKRIYELYREQKTNIDETNSSLLASLPELCAEYEVNFRRMLLCLIINMPGEGYDYSSICNTILYKMLVLTTSETQNDIINNLGGKDNKDLGFLVNISNTLYDGIIKSFVDDFNIDFIKYQKMHTILFNNLKIFKFLCEEHNNYFQDKILCSLEYIFTKLSECKMMSTNKSKFMNDANKDLVQIDTEDSMSFFNFMINTLHKILVVTKKAHNKGHIGFYYDIFYIIVELLVEIIQGNKKEILVKSRGDDLKNNKSLFTFKTFVSVVSEILFDDSLIEGPGFRARLLLVSFFIAIIEEKNNEEIQKIIMKFLTLNKVLASMRFTMKNYFYEQTKDDPKYQEYYHNFNEKQMTQREFVFDHTIFSFYKYHYFHSNMSKESKEFELANNYYKYIKKLSISRKSPEAEDIIKQIDKLSEAEAKKKFSLFDKKIVKPSDIAPINLINEKEKSISIAFIEHFYIIKFFELITKVVEVRLPQEHRNVQVVFTVPCEMIHLTEMTKEEFIYNVDRSGETSKKFELVRSISLFQLEINYFKNTNVSVISKFILNLDYIYVQIVMYLFATMFLIFMLFTLEGYKKIEPIIESGEERRLRRLYRNLIEIPNKITESIDLSIDEWGQIYDYICYVFCGLNGLLIFIWILEKMPLYYILDKFKFIEQNKIQNENELSFLNKTYIMIVDTIIGRDYISTLLYMFVVSVIGAIMERGEIVYAFLLIAIINLNKTLKGITKSIKVRGRELGASFLLLIFLVYFYSNLGFFYLNEDYEADIENDIPDNYCLCLAFCFMTNFDAGIRARGGAADQMVRISFERNTKRYVVRVFYDVTYFLICIIIMIDLVFGIILGTFSEMREEERQYDDDKVNHCFLCHITREIIEKKKEDFQFHREKKHYLWNYVEYMIFLKFADAQTLNAFNSFARFNLDKKNICFLPSCQDNFTEEDEEKEKEKEENEEDEEEEEEESEENSDEESGEQADNDDEGNHNKTNLQEFQRMGNEAYQENNTGLIN